jgi:hypothetical protein|tara:strand:+ start:56 stop:553 length:498 start_codon:yes stop_codon:yes gene_type:complete
MNLRERGGQYLAMQGRGRKADRAQLFGADAYGRAGNSYGNSHPSAHQEHANDMLERQNDEVIDTLFETARNIKQYSQTINRQAKEQNDMLGGMSIQMDKTQGLLGRTLNKMEAMAANGGSKHMCYMVCFFVFMIWMLYFFAFSKRADVVLEVTADASLSPMPSLP